MRFLVKATIPSAAGNAMVRDANMQSKMERVMLAFVPEYGMEKVMGVVVEMGQKY